MQASTSEKIIAYAAIVLSVCAVGISLVEVWTMRRQSKADVWPYVLIAWHADVPGLITANANHIWKRDESKGGFGFSISNKGVGPAIVENMFVWVDGKPVVHWQDFYKSIGASEQTSNALARTRDRPLSPGEYYVAFVTQDSTASAAIVKERSRIEIGVCFASIYGDRWYQHRDMGADTHIKYETCDTCPWPDSLAMQAR